MTKAPKGSKPTLTVAASNTPEDVALTTLVLQAASKPMSKASKPAMPEATFSPEAMSNLLNKLNEQAAELAALKASMVENAKAKVDKAARNVAGKSEKSTANEQAAIKAFKKLGIAATPRVDTFTFNLWLAKGMRPKEGTKAVRVANLRLFHSSQVRPLSAAETKAAKEQLAAAKLRREGSTGLELQ